MLIGIDARLNFYRRAGIAQYTQQLLAALAPLVPDETLLTLQHPEQLRPLVVAPNVRRRSIYTPPHHRFEQLALPLELLPLRLDLLHSPDFIPPLRRPCPAVITIHDLAFLHYPEILDQAASRYYGQIRQAVRSAEGIIAVSETTRADIVNLLQVDPARIAVIYEAAAPTFRPLELAPDASRSINGWTLHANEFVLFVSTLEPRKNLPTLLRALRICIDRKPAAGYQLVVVGARGWRYESIFENLTALNLTDHVIFLDSVSTDDLAWLYNACRFYTNPSIYEGFGLPLLEAMACGAAVIASNVSSLPEIADDAALLLPPDDPGAWAEGIGALWQDAESRRLLGIRAANRASLFSWQRAARETLGVYRQVVEAGRGQRPALGSSSLHTSAAASTPLAEPLAEPTDPAPLADPTTAEQLILPASLAPDHSADDRATIAGAVPTMEPAEPTTAEQLILPTSLAPDHSADDRATIAGAVPTMEPVELLPEPPAFELPDTEEATAEAATVVFHESREIAVQLAEEGASHHLATANGNHRPCLRCGTALQPEELQTALTLRADGPNLRIPRLWACPVCSYSELVVENLPAEAQPQATVVEPSAHEVVVAAPPQQPPAATTPAATTPARRRSRKK